MGKLESESENIGTPGKIALYGLAGLMAVAPIAHKYCGANDGLQPEEKQLPTISEPVKGQEAPRKQTEESDTEELSDAQRLIRVLLENHTLTPEQERELCQGYLDEVKGVDPNLNPDVLIGSIDDFRFCADSIDSKEANGLYADAASFFDLQTELLRCNSIGEPFAREQLKQCEQDETALAEEVIQRLKSEGLNVSTTYYPDYAYSEEAGRWITPGPAVLVNCPDNSCHVLVQFRIRAAGEFDGYNMEVIADYGKEGSYDAPTTIAVDSKDALVKAFVEEHKALISPAY